MIDHDKLLYLYENSIYNDRYDVMISSQHSDNKTKKILKKNMSSVQVVVENNFDIIKNL